MRGLLAAPVRLRRPYNAENNFPRASILIRYEAAHTARFIITYFGLSSNRLYTTQMGESIHSKEYKVIIQKLKNARIQSGITQVQVAAKLKKPQSYVSKIERRERRIDIVELQQLLKIYKKGLKEFF